jgi:ParB family transcriptional regulator, chromosome partitioning protein
MQIRMIEDRRYEMVPIDKIKVINSRLRGEDQFQMNVQSIDAVGLLKPILVNDKFLPTSGLYELVCGEGRLIAHGRLGANEIMAEVITCTRKDAYLLSLIENLARSRPRTMEFARALKQMHDQDWTYKEIAKVACRTEEYIRQYIALANNGEERLIRGVEQGLFPISFAVQVAQTDHSNFQNVLMDAFDQGIVNCQNFARARSIINARFDKRNRKGKSSNPASYTVKALVSDITSTTKVKDSYVQQAKKKENRLILLLDCIETLFKDKAMLDLLRQEALIDRPDLLGTYHMAEQT